MFLRMSWDHGKLYPESGRSYGMVGATLFRLRLSAGYPKNGS